MATKQHYPFPLGELLHLLKTNGYDVSIEHILHLQSIFLTSSVQKIQSGELKFILAPLLAKNEEEQANIYRLVDDYIVAKTRETETAAVSLWKKLFSRKYLLRVKFATLTLVVITAIIFYFVQSADKQKKEITLPDKTDTKKPGNLADTLPKDNRADVLPDKPTTPVSKETPIEFKHEIIYEQPITLQRRNINLQISGLLGILIAAVLYHIIFYEQRKLMEREERKKEVETPDRNDDRWASSNYDDEDERLVKELEPANLSFPPKNYLIQRTREFRRIKTALKKPVMIEGRALNIPKSIYSSTRKAGFLSLLYDEHIEERQFVVFIEGKKEGHLTQLFDYLIHFLQAEKVLIRKFYFTNDIKTLSDDTGKWQSLHELSIQSNGTHLLILGSGRSLFTDEFELKTNVLGLLTSWPQKYIITPTPLKDWSYMEDQLNQHEFQIIPAEIEAIELLTTAMLELSFVPRKKIVRKIRALYSTAKFDFYSSDEIRNYLDDNVLFQFVCSLAVYPKLDWNLTLALLAAFGETWPQERKGEIFHYNALLKIARIPWLQDTKLEQSLRLQLLNCLEPDNEVLARDTIMNLLKDIQAEVPKQSLAYTELDVQLTLNRFFLFAHDEWKYKTFSYTKKMISGYWENLKEWALKERVEKQLSGIMPPNAVGKPQTINEYMLEEREIEVQHLKVSKAYVLLLPSLLLYILFSIFKPHAVYDLELERVTFQVVIQKNPLCQKQFDHLEINSDQVTSVPLQKNAASENINIEDVDPESPITLKLIDKDNNPYNLEIPANYHVVTLKLDCN
ncbi:hypothetical protein [Segetibacter aerophilus]|uniref:Uncharacterized protein n=1 Tax=Segetibacter aerophilus TaxID=670293 RepID=A0A512B8A9_9BACT|nr:hypothetical protein [Segetibacter aerophilus]GEO08191.1 hypothetical protein SAE01_06870 [Segetibacter aerophilus]